MMGATVRAPAAIVGARPPSVASPCSGSDCADDDVLGGFKARWYPFGAEDLTFQVGYEFGEINTFSGGLRFVF